MPGALCGTTHAILSPLVTIAVMKKVMAARKPVLRRRSKKSLTVKVIREQQAVAEREAVRTEVSGLRAGASRLMGLFDYEAGQLLKDGTMVPEPIVPNKRVARKTAKTSPRRGRRIEDAIVER